MYYGMILGSVVMFGGCFALNDVYRRLCGSNIAASLWFSLISSAAGLVVLLAANGFRFEFTLFTLLISSVSALNGFGFTFCGFKALGSINLSLYSLFSMLGGMALPFLQGIIFYGEEITLAKVVCFVFICLALLLTVDREKKKSGGIYYLGIFVLNGMSGVLSKIFASSPYPKTSAEGFSILSALCAVLMAAVLLPFFAKGHKNSLSVKAVAVSSAGGVINRIANLLLVIALAHVDASVQYPMVTGGVIIVSTLLCFFGKNKPSKKELASVALAFTGMLLLFVIPV